MDGETFERIARRIRNGIAPRHEILVFVDEAMIWRGMALRTERSIHTLVKKLEKLEGRENAEQSKG